MSEDKKDNLFRLVHHYERVNIDALEVYRLYCCLKGHFSRSDMSKYPANALININRIQAVNLVNRKDCKFFHVLAKKYTADIIYLLMVYGFTSDVDKHIKEFIEIDTKELYNKRMPYMVNQIYSFENDLINIFTYMKDKNISFARFIFGQPDGFPLIVRMIILNHVSIETFILLDSILDLINKIDERINKCHKVWFKIKVRLNAYKKLLIIDKLQCAKILKKVKESY